MSNIFTEVDEQLIFTDVDEQTMWILNHSEY